MRIGVLVASYLGKLRIRTRTKTGTTAERGKRTTAAAVALARALAAATSRFQKAIVQLTIAVAILARSFAAAALPAFSFGSCARRHVAIDAVGTIRAGASAALAFALAFGPAF